MKERIKQLLISGLKASEITSIVGCTPSYIAQLSKDEDFMKAVTEGRMAVQTAKSEDEHIDQRYQNTEHLLLNAIAEKIPEATLGEVTRAIEVINKRKDDNFKRKNPVLPGPAVNINVVSLALPAQALRTYTAPVVEMNSQKEIIAIEGKALAPMSSDGVRNLFAQIQNVIPASNEEQTKIIQEM